ncbi:deoxyribodipyrimidine photolyase [Candidatus Bathyarchaeota archaeon]|nr:deoxyribodipyrimidine photolyase [Candidatus Bathyarchaeota archaeon]
MQAGQRDEQNPALEYSVIEANKRNQPLVVFFGLTDYPEANSRHYRFMLRGLRDTYDGLVERGAQLVVQFGDPAEGCIELAGSASLVVLDRGYQRLQRGWYKVVLDAVDRAVVQVEGEVVVPVEVAAEKEMYMAVHLRKRINPLIPDYLVEIPVHELDNSKEFDIDSVTLDDVNGILEQLDEDVSVDPGSYKGGREEALRRFKVFLDDRLEDYAELRNDPNENIQSDMSPYLHYGQVSPVELAKASREIGGVGADEYIEQLVVRRELAINMVYYNPYYDSIKCLPDWARTTLREHSGDERAYTYTRDELEKGQTHDYYWNKAQLEMIETGKMHGYMRMYWGKKILEWMFDPEIAYETALYLNNRYELDGRSCNGYTGVAWCFGKHDRAWKERKIFGKVRYMNSRGLERKYDMEVYLAKGFNI